MGGGNYCLAQETAYKTLSFPDENNAYNKVSSYEKTWTAKISDFSWDIENFNNNQWGNNWTYIKAGSKSSASVATIGNKTAFDKAIGKIVVDVETEVLAKSVKSIYLEVTSDAAFADVIETVSLPKPLTNYGKNDFVFEIKNPKANLFYKLVFDLNSDQRSKGKKNGFVQINKVEYYEDASNKTATSLSFDAPSYEISKDQTLTKLPTLKAGEQTLSDKTITWSSDNTEVATVDENGTVKGIGAGTAKITATFAGDEVYKTSTASYEIKVKGAPELSFPQTSYTIEMGDAFSTPKLNGLPEGVTPAYTSSNKEVATVDAVTGEVNIVGVGTTTITVTSPNTDIYEEATASYELTVKLATSKEETFDLTSGYENKKPLAPIAGKNVTLNFSSGSMWYAEGTALRFYGDETLTITANSRIKCIEFVYGDTKNYPIDTNKLEFSSGKYDITKHVWDFSGEDTKTAMLKNKKGSKQIRIQKIIVTTDVSVGTITIATPEGFGTYYNSNSYILPKGLTAFGYKEANTDGTLVKTDEFTGGDVVPANAALVVKGNTGNYECYATDQVATKTLEGNLLKGVAKATTVEKAEGFKRYVLTTVNNVLGFYRTKSGNIKVPANRAYLELTEAQAQAVSFFQLDGETTGIENATATTKEAPKAIYTLSGVRLKVTTTKGLPAGAYVVNGKVVIVK